MSFPKTTVIMIERERSTFPVTVSENDLSSGWFEALIDGGEDQRYELDQHESDEARALFDAAQIDEEPDHDEIHPNCLKARHQSAQSREEAFFENRKP